MKAQTIYFLYPSNLFVSSSPRIVTTILGSCVSVCLWDSVKGIGGINHYMLPLWNGDGLQSPRYGNVAISKLIQKMIYLGSDISMLKAKIIGGAEVLGGGSEQFRVGARNILVAKEMLKDAGIPVVGSSVGGKFGRKISFDTGSGAVQQNLLLGTVCTSKNTM